MKKFAKKPAKTMTVAKVADSFPARDVMAVAHPANKSFTAFCGTNPPTLRKAREFKTKYPTLFAFKVEKTEEKTDTPK